MNMPRTLPHVRTAKALITSHRAVCEGFLAQALAKTERANPFVRRALDLWGILQGIAEVSTVAHRRDLRDDFAAAAGFSDKAQSHLTEEELEQGFERVLLTIASHAPTAWREQIVYRYLLTKGDSLGGTMRNITGALAGKQLAESLIASVHSRGLAIDVEQSTGKPEKVHSLSWPSRVLLFDKKPQFIGKNVDVIVLNSSNGDHGWRERLERPEDYVACGELKGGIDPAGADEHWKTASSALDRIRRSFRRASCPALFFAGAAIEAAMAKEIFAQLRRGKLTYVANLTVPEQVADLVDWLAAL